LSDANWAHNMDKNFDTIADDCNDLSPYATQARYPNAIEIEEPETESALRKAEHILVLCERLIELDE